MGIFGKLFKGPEIDQAKSADSKQKMRRLFDSVVPDGGQYQLVAAYTEDVKKAYQNKYPTDAFIIYPDGRHYLAINTFEWLEDEKLFIYVDQGPEEQAFETFFKTCYATK